MAGLGAAMYTGEVGRGDSIAVFGCGGVGNAAIAGARLAGANPIIGVDIDERKLAWAREFGATHTVNSRDTDPVEAIRALTDGHGADVCIEAVGRPEVLEQAFYARDLAGTVVQVGVPDPSMRIELPMIEFFGRGGALEAEVVRRLPPVARLPDAHRPLPRRAARPRALRERDHRPRRHRRRVPQDGARRGAALRRRPLTTTRREIGERIAVARARRRASERRGAGGVALWRVQIGDAVIGDHEVDVAREVWTRRRR